MDTPNLAVYNDSERRAVNRTVLAALSTGHGLTVNGIAYDGIDSLGYIVLVDRTQAVRFGRWATFIVVPTTGFVGRGHYFDVETEADADFFARCRKALVQRSAPSTRR